MLRNFLRIAVGLSLIVIVHNYCVPILPRFDVPLPNAAMQPVDGTRVFSIPFAHSLPDTRVNPRSQVRVTEDGAPLGLKLRLPGGVYKNAGGCWCHAPGRLLLSSRDNSDLRHNGRLYVAEVPILYSPAAGCLALIGLIAATLALRRLAPPRETATEPAPVPTKKIFWLTVGAAAVTFAVGLYLNTGTLSPYANTLVPVVDPATGYLYNIDHPFHRTLYAFAANEPRAAWIDSLLLRRILHGILARPWMDALGYETGGVVFNLLLNLAGFAAGVAMVRRHVGACGAMLAAWLLALYPGAHYWVGQPYLYGTIFPLSVLAFWILLELGAASLARVTILSLALGAIYLGYDLYAFFLPASVILLLWQRRILAAALSVLLQFAPLAAWLWLLKHVVGVSLENRNSDLYHQLLSAFFNARQLPEFLGRSAALPDLAAHVFMGANFLFLPLLALAAWALDFRWQTLVRHRAVPALLASGIALFVFCNLPPPQDAEWNLQGSWIARLYQPLFPALVVSLALWWQELPLIARGPRRGRVALVGAALAGNALICFGPALGNPLRLSERAYYRFYDHTEMHWMYRINLETYGRRPLGFPRPIKAP